MDELAYSHKYMEDLMAGSLISSNDATISPEDAFAAEHVYLRRCQKRGVYITLVCVQHNRCTYHVHADRNPNIQK